MRASLASGWIGSRSSLNKTNEKEQERNGFLKTAKAVCVAAFGLLSSWLGVLAIPIYVLVACNIMDYITGLAAAHRRNQKVSSYVGVLGIAKKVLHVAAHCRGGGGGLAIAVLRRQSGL